MSQIDPHRLIEPQAYADFGYPHEEFARLRREEPVAFFEAEGWSPFWAVTKHENIVEISKQPDKFSNQSGATFMPDRGHAVQDDIRAQLRTIIDMDPPDHRDYRKIVSASFSPRAIARLTPVVERVAKELVDGLGREGEADLIPDFASIHPLKVVCHLLGVPEADEPKVLRLTNELFGNADPEFQRSGEVNDNMKALFAEFWAYFGELLTDRRGNPREDLVSVFANAKVRGEPMGELETLGYCLIAFTAGHETTRGAISGGLQILSERPDLRKQWAKNLDKSRLAIDEIIRYVTPVTHMMRTALTDYQLGDKQIKAGDTLVHVLRLGQPRRGRLRGRGRDSARPLPQPPRRLRRRRALLHRLAPGPLDQWLPCSESWCRAWSCWSPPASPSAPLRIWYRASSTCPCATASPPAPAHDLQSRRGSHRIAPKTLHRTPERSCSGSLARRTRPIRGATAPPTS